MSNPNAADRDPTERKGAATAGTGTPLAVDVAGDRRAQGTIALFVAGPLIWMSHFLVVYLVAEAGCTGDGPGLQIFDPPVPTVVTLAATAVAALACLACAAWAYRRWRADQHAPADGGLEPADRGGALAFAGFMLSLFGVVEVLFVGLPALVLPAC